MQRFKIEYAGEVKKTFSSIHNCCTQEEGEEIRDFLEQLKSTGDIQGFNLTRCPGIDSRSGVREVYGKYFKLSYTFNKQSTSIKIWTCHILSTYEKDEWKKMLWLYLM